MRGKAVILSMAALVVCGPATAQSLDVPEYPTFDDRLQKSEKKPKSTEQEFRIRGKIEVQKSNLVICSEGAASGEDLDESLAACNAAIKEEPGDGDGYYYRGFVLYHLARFQDAEADFSTAIDLRAARIAESYFQRGVCKEEQGRLREAAFDFKKAYELKPQWSAARRKVDEYHWALE